MFQIKQSEATAARRRIPVLFVSSTDGFTPVTPTSPAAYISVNGATWVATTNAVAVATLAAGQSLAGVYYLELTAAEVGALGWITVNIQATNARQYNAQIQVMAYDPYDVVRIGLTSIPNVAQGTTGALPTGNATGQVTVVTNNDKTGYALTQTFPTNFSTLAITAGGSVTAGTVSDKTGYSLSASQTFSTTGSVGSVTGSVGSVTGSVASVTGAVGSVTAGVTVSTNNDKTGYSLATAPPTAAQISTQVWSEALPGTFTSGQAGFKLDAGTATNVWAAGTRTLTAGTNIVLAKGTGITGFNDITTTQVWSETLPGTYTSTQAGFKLNAAGSASDPWSTTLPGAYTSGTAGFIIGNRLDTNVGSRMATFTYTTPPTAAAIATQVWSEALPGTYTSGQAGFKLNAAGSASDPWSTALPGAYSVGSAGNIIGNMVSNTWAAGTRTLTAGTNIVLAKGTGITGFNDITALSVWDVLASTVSITGSMGLQLKTNIDATVSSRLATSGYTVPPTAATISSTVWGDTVASYSNTASFGYRLLRSDSTNHSGDVLVNGNGSANNHNRIDSDMHAIDSDHTAATNLKNLLPVAGKVAGTVTGIENVTFPTNFGILAIQSATGYVTSTNGGGSGGSSVVLNDGPYTLVADNNTLDVNAEVFQNDARTMTVYCKDASGAEVNLSGATLTAKVYNSAGSLVATYSGTSPWAGGGVVTFGLTATVTATVGTYTITVTRSTSASDTTIFGPLRLYVRSI